MDSSGFRSFSPKRVVWHLSSSKQFVSNRKSGVYTSYSICTVRTCLSSIGLSSGTVRGRTLAATMMLKASETNHVKAIIHFAVWIEKDCHLSTLHIRADTYRRSVFLPARSEDALSPPP